MFPVPNRRDFLQILCGGATGLSLASLDLIAPTSAAARQVTPLHATRLTDNLCLIAGAGGNVVMFVAADGVTLVNGGAADRTAAVLKAVADQADGIQSGGIRVRTLFNTDWHPLHTGANEVLGKAGAQIIAHENTKQYLGADRFVDWENRTYKARTAQALPSKTFRTSGTIGAGGDRIDYGYLGQAHTDGDIYVFFPGANVLVAGDVLAVGAYPICDYTSGGWLGGLITANKTLLDLTNADTRIVPGTGPLQTRADLQAQHDMLATLRDRLGKMMKQGMGAEDMLAAGVTKDFDEKWGSPERFVSTAYRGLWLHVREVGGVV